jgi:uridylate kinase
MDAEKNGARSSWSKSNHFGVRHTIMNAVYRISMLIARKSMASPIRMGRLGRYYAKVIARIVNAQSVLILGPG